jgi:hypothetical protein
VSSNRRERHEAKAFSEERARSIGAEETYEEDLIDVEAIRRTLLEHASRVARRLIRGDHARHAPETKR